MHKGHAFEYKTNKWIKDASNDDHGEDQNDDKEDKFSLIFLLQNFS